MFSAVSFDAAQNARGRPWFPTGGPQQPSNNQLRSGVSKLIIMAR